MYTASAPFCFGLNLNATCKFVNSPSVFVRLCSHFRLCWAAWPSLLCERSPACCQQAGCHLHKLVCVTKRKLLVLFGSLQKHRNEVQFSPCAFPGHTTCPPIAATASLNFFLTCSSAASTAACREVKLSPQSAVVNHVKLFPRFATCVLGNSTPCVNVPLGCSYHLFCVTMKSPRRGLGSATPISATRLFAHRIQHTPTKVCLGSCRPDTIFRFKIC